MGAIVALHAQDHRLTESIDFLRLDASRRLARATRGDLGQFMTPAPVARLMASMFPAATGAVLLLDAGAGVGSLTAAFVEAACATREPPRRIRATVYEIDPALLPYLKDTLRACRERCAAAGVEFEDDVQTEDFLSVGSEMLDGGLFARPVARFTHAILNPPYRKIHTESEARRLIRAVGVETSNLYTAFLALVVKLLDPGGELVAITPRSFCNGPYFKPFRDLFLDAMELRRIHVFEARDRAFGDDNVLQENVILHATKRRRVEHESDRTTVEITGSADAEDPSVTVRSAPFSEVVRPGDPQRFIRIVTDDLDQRVAECMEALPGTLEGLDLEVSTGRVVDFRAKGFLRPKAAAGDAPLIYPTHFADGRIGWPKDGKKPNALRVSPETRELLMPDGVYVLVKRFSSKEERRRVTAAVYDLGRGPVGFENHLNVYHRRGTGLPRALATGLAVFLNATLVDLYFRQFSGHTQVNAADLRSFRYPKRETLEALGEAAGSAMPNQDEIDRLVREGVFGVTNDPVLAKKKVEEACVVLKALGLPKEQQNQRAALTLLALLHLRAGMRWSQATAPLLGIRPIMDWFAEHYGRKYAENTRETIRRFTVHQFVQAGIVIANPDEPGRPPNSPKNVYQVSEDALSLIRTFGSKTWSSKLAGFHARVPALRQKYAAERAMHRIPVTLPSGKKVTLSPGGQNEVVKAVIEEFCPRFAPGGHVLYIGDADEKWATFEKKSLAALGVHLDEHGKMPDVVVHHVKKGWIVLVEAVTSHGPVNPKRRDELRRLFQGSKVGLVYVTSFLDRRTLSRYLGDISWETEVWVAESPTHLIHFDGERFLGPYPAR